MAGSQLSICAPKGGPDSVPQGEPSHTYRSPGARPTLEDVARLAKVSTATVSRCLNSPDQVLQQTRERVLAAVAQMGYTPNFGARALASKRTGTIGAIVPTMENSIFARCLQAFQEELWRNGRTLLVASSFYRPDLEEEQIHTLAARGADALLLIGHDRNPEVYDYLKRVGVPYLVAWVHDPSQANPSIGFDNRASMKDLAEHVIQRGHRRIGFISAERATNDRARKRVEGVIDAMVASGLDPDTLQVIETTYSFENGRTAFAALIRSELAPTAIMCGNDVLAVGALDMAREMGLNVPGDVSITGFDNIDIAQIASPPLTTVHVPHREMGRRAATLMVQMLNAVPSAGSVELQTRLVLRDTLGPAPAG
jgi:LacI family transcriptional regulator